MKHHMIFVRDNNLQGFACADDQEYLDKFKELVDDEIIPMKAIVFLDGTYYPNNVPDELKETATIFLRLQQRQWQIESYKTVTTLPGEVPNE